MKTNPRTRPGVRRSRRVRLGSLYGLSLIALPSAVAASVLLWLLLLVLAAALLRLPFPQAVLAATLALGLHWFSEVFHQLGHAWAARRAGYPMQAVRFWTLLGASVYPRDEPRLPARVHIRRALGGPLASLLLTLIAAAVLALLPRGVWLWWVALFFCLENLLVFTLGALLPLGFTDGSTLLEWWGKR